MVEQAVLDLPSPTVPPSSTDIIRKALDTLADPQQWAKGVFLARDGRGRETSALDPRAVAWSVIGALRYAGWVLGLPRVGWPMVLWEAYDRVEAQLPREYRENLVAFQNDSFVKHADVVALMSRALRGGKQ